MTEANKHLRCEQSDLIVVLLNLAVIPDEVVRRQTWSRGWQQRFLENMNEYKANFKGFCEWRFQDQELEDAYWKFVKEQEKTDPDYKNW